MDSVKGFQRSFIIFSNEDQGYEAGQRPSGHVRLEMREGKGKLNATVHNLRPGNGKFIYNLYLLGISKDGLIAVNTGQFEEKSSKAEKEWGFDSRNVGLSGCGIDAFFCVAVIVEYIDRPYDMVICPLAAYKGKKSEWRSAFRMAKSPTIGTGIGAHISEGQADKANQHIGHAQKEDMQPAWPKKAGDAGKQIEVMQGAGNAGVQEPGLFDTGGEFTKEPGTPEIETDEMETSELQGAGAESEYIQAHEPQATGRADIRESSPGFPLQDERVTPDGLYDMPDRRTHSTPDGQLNQLAQQQNQEENIQRDRTTPDNISKDASGQDQTAAQSLDNTREQHGTKAAGDIDTACIYLNGNMCPAFLNASTNTGNLCNACHIHCGESKSRTQNSADITLLKEEIGRYFEKSDPFNSRRSDYIWWKVTNPVNLNNILYQCNIRSPLLFNPAVMLAHYKYKHLIIGIYQHRDGYKQYVVCGVPGMHMVDRKPFGEMSRWVQVEGSRLRYGAFGYWLVYIDPEDGKILNIS